MVARILGIALLAGAAVAWVGLGRSNAPAIWVPLSLPLPARAGETATGRFTADADGFYEIQVEADVTLDPSLLATYIGTTRGPSRLSLAWTVEGDDGPAASGEARQYLYVERGPRSLPARLKRVLLRMPYGRNDAHRSSLGLSGSATQARGVGRFRTRAGKSYELRLTANADHTPLAPGDPRVVVRPERRRWQRHFERARPWGYAVLLGAAAGCVLLALSFLRRAPGPPEG